MITPRKLKDLNYEICILLQSSWLFLSATFVNSPLLAGAKFVLHELNTTTSAKKMSCLLRHTTNTLSWARVNLFNASLIIRIPV